MSIHSNDHPSHSSSEDASRVRQEWQPAPDTAPLSQDGLSAAFERYILACKAKNLSPATIRDYTQKVQKLLEWCRQHGATELHDITPDLIRGYMVDARERGLADYSVLTYFAAHHAFFAFCAEAQIIEHSPMEKIRSPKVDFEPRPAISTEVVAKLLHACTSLRDLALLLFLLETGCRAGEVVHLVCADIDLALKTATVRKSKARKARLVYFGAHTQLALAKYYAQRGAPHADEAVWLTKHGTPLAYGGLRQLMRRLGQRAGVPRFGPHALRRTFAVQAHYNGMGDRTLMTLLGHSTPEMLRHYLPLGDDQIRRAYKDFGPFKDLDLDLPNFDQSQD